MRAAPNPTLFLLIVIKAFDIYSSKTSTSSSGEHSIVYYGCFLKRICIEMNVRT